MNRQEIYLSTSKHKSHNSNEALIEFENGSKIISVDVASVNSRGQRANIIWIDGRYLKQENRKFRRNYMNELKLKWHQKLRIELDFIWDDFKEWVVWIIYKIKKGE